MSLTKYKEKRNFKRSPEPSGGKPDGDKLRFVVQKHKASRLHYDFRLEMEGVLKSWAVPKGPSMDPNVKHLALMVEDHPYDYRNFEGIIPDGYGAGTVIVWDEGYYELADAEDKPTKTQDKELQKALRAGKLHIVLHGKKLIGEFGLVKTENMAPNSWLLFKVKDKYSSTTDITLKDKSVISNKTLSQVKKGTNHNNGKEPVTEFSQKNQKENSRNKQNSAKSKSENNSKEKDEESSKDKDDSKGKRTRFPNKIAPMLATLIDKPFNKKGWQFEIKWDGYRIIAFCNKEKIELKSRNDISYTDKFYPISKVIQHLNFHAVLDGEVVVLAEDGKPDFEALQNWESKADGELYYYVFDLLWMNGKDLKQVQLSERRTYLKQLIPQDSIIRFSENFDVNGIDFFEAVKKMGLEGIIAKKSDSVYSEGKRSNNWLKIKANIRQEMVICGYTKNENSSRLFSSLLLGVYNKGKLYYTGKVGTGFTDKQQREMIQLFKPYIQKEPPFAQILDINKSSRFRNKQENVTVMWMKPELVCEVSYTEMTADQYMRQATFHSMRDDKKATDITLETANNTNELIMQKAKNLNEKPRTGKTKGRRKFLNPDDDTQIRKVNGHEIKFTNLDKVYWPTEKITKRDMLNYYYEVAPYILPYLKNRPQSMNRHPDGIEGESFYFKDVTGTAPEWIETFEYKSDADDRVRNYLIANDKASLLYMATLGCIEMNPWHSRVGSEDKPDWCIIDLDPANNTFQQVIDAANVTKQILDSLGVESYAKTSGSTGIHIYIPLRAKYTYDQSKEFARVIATLVQKEIPKYTSVERSIKSRKGKMYIDFLQNRAHATVVAPYSLRPKPGVPVSMPLHWDEVKKGLKMKDFTIFNALDRIKSEGDIFKPVLGKGINLENVDNNFSDE